MIMRYWILLHFTPKPTRTDNNCRFDAIISSNGVNNKISSGVLDQLLFHLPGLSNGQSRGPSDCFKLEVTKEVKDFLWFTKSTLSCFLCLVSSSEWLKSATLIENEISQLEDARNFHLALYAKDHANISGGLSIDNRNSNDADLTTRVHSDRSSDPTKNDLLRALDLRLLALKEELSSSLDRALGSVPSTDRLSNLTSFCDYFGASKMRDHLVKYLESCPNKKALTVSENDLLKKSERRTSDITTQPSSQREDLKIARTSSTLAKIALAERQISSESEDSDSSEGAKTSTDRSRPLIRAPSPRRSASPMRRVQIGRSGSRRPAAVAIRSLNYFPPREKIPFKDINTDGNSSCDEEQEKPPNRTEASARRMSVQDAINLFESKQKDHNLTSQIRRSSTEALVIATKPVLRRWSSGMCESNKQETEATSTVNIALNVEEDKNVPEVLKVEIPQSSVPSNEETQEKVTEASEWSKKKEAELNQMLMKFMETKPSKYGSNASPSGHKRGLTKQQKEKTETSKKQTEKKAVQSRITQETSNQRKTKTVSRVDPPPQTQKPRRNSSPPVLSKKDVPKSSVTKKPSPKSTLPLIRSSLASNTYTRAAGTPVKSQSTLSPSTPTLKTERTPRPLKSGKLPVNETKKVPPKSHEDKKQSSKSKVLTPSRNEVGVISAKSTVSAKPRLQNKVPKKSTVVPLESKPSKKGSTLEPKVNASKINTNLMPVEEKQTDVEAGEPVSPPLNNHDDHPNAAKVDVDLTPDKVESIEVGFPDVIKTKVNDEENKEGKVELISSAAWVEVDQETIHESDSSSTCQVTASDLAPTSSSRGRHSLSQMLQAENGEPEVLEWGNAENPPALVYQKDAPKGLKRLLKFARKSKGDINLSDRSSPSVFSDIEEDSEEVKVNGKKVSARPKNMLSESCDGGYPENKSVDFSDAREILPAQTGHHSSLNSRKLREGQSNKATRSFFSLSTFRSSKTIEPKSR